MAFCILSFCSRETSLSGSAFIVTHHEQKCQITRKAVATDTPVDLEIRKLIHVPPQQ